jgi:FkbM family methyltransferase
MAQSHTFRNGIVINIDETDKSEYRKASTLGHINPSLEFYLVDNGTNFTKAVIVGAGCGVATGILEGDGVETVNIEPNSDRYAILDANYNAAENYNKACSDENGTGTMYFFEDNKSGGILDMVFGDSSQAVDVITVDSLNLSDIDLMIVYANGKEYDVLVGAETTLSNNAGTKVVMDWKPDQILNINTVITYLKENFNSIKIIHWEDGDEITYKTMVTDKPEEHLRAVMSATLLLE